MKNCECSICGKIFDETNSKKPKLSLNHHLNFCKFRQFLLTGLKIEREDLPNLLDSYGSVSNLHRELSPQFPASLNYYFLLFKDDNIDVSIKKSCNSKQTKDRRKNTNLEKYGCWHNFCKEHPSRREWEAKLLEEEGITNVFQRESVKRKSIETMLEKYGVEHAAQYEAFKVTEDYYIKKYGELEGKKRWKDLCYCKGKSMKASYYIEKYGEELGLAKWKEKIENLNRCRDGYKLTKISSLNIRFKELLDKLNLEYTDEFCLWDDTRSYYYDFKVGNYIFELNGDFWHANPQQYKSTDILKFPGKPITAQELWDKDEVKRKIAESYGYKVIYYWECQINDNNLWNKIKEKLTEYANIKNKNNKESTQNG